GTVTIGGTGTYNVTGTSSVSGGTVNLNIASGAGNWAESSGSLQGSGIVTVPSGKSFSWTGGAMSGSGTTTIASGGTLTIGDNVTLSRTVTNNGTATWTAGQIAFLDGTFNNNNAFTAQPDNSMVDGGGTKDRKSVA